MNIELINQKQLSIDCSLKYKNLLILKYNFQPFIFFFGKTNDVHAILKSWRTHHSYGQAGDVILNVLLIMYMHVWTTTYVQITFRSTESQQNVLRTKGVLHCFTSYVITLVAKAHAWTHVKQNFCVGAVLINATIQPAYMRHGPFCYCKTCPIDWF